VKLKDRDDSGPRQDPLREEYEARHKNPANGSRISLDLERNGQSDQAEKNVRNEKRSYGDCPRLEFPAADSTYIRSEPLKLRFNVFVAAINVIHTQHFSRSFGSKAGKNEGRTGPKVR